MLMKFIYVLSYYLYKMKIKYLIPPKRIKINIQNERNSGYIIHFILSHLKVARTLTFYDLNSIQNESFIFKRSITAE